MYIIWHIVIFLVVWLDECYNRGSGAKRGGQCAVTCGSRPSACAGLCAGLAEPRTQASVFSKYSIC